MLTVDEARARILGAIEPLPAVEVPLRDSLGGVVAEDVTAPHALPRFANSAMDGYAVRRADVEGATEASPAALTSLGEVRAGEATSVAVAPGTCLRIMTGAPLPNGADAVVPIEVAREEGGRVEVFEEPPEHGHVRPAGDDVEAGRIVVTAGSEVGPGEIALLASLGVSPLRVHPAPRVALVVTGDELVGIDEEPGPGRIRDSNSIALEALALDAGARPLLFKTVGDDLEGVVAALREGAEAADLVVSSGGVSVGRYDYVKEAVERLGSIDLWRIAMQPGKPVVSGEVGGKPFLGLPGNPVSVHVSFEQFVRPVIQKMRGARMLTRPVVDAVLTESLSKKPGRLHFVRVRLEVGPEGFRATPLGKQGSHIQSSLIGCDGVARFEIEQTELHPGDTVQVEVWRIPTG